MKLLLLVVAALPAIHALSTPFAGLSWNHKQVLTPRGKATEVQSGNSRGGPRRKDVPQGKQEWTQDNVEHIKQLKKQALEQGFPKGKDFRYYDEKPPVGESGFTYDSKTNIATIYYGDDCQFTSDHISYRIAHNAKEKDKMWQPLPKTEAGKKAKEERRAKSQSGGPTDRKVWREEKPPAGVIHHDDDQATLIEDTSVSQMIEGTMCKKAYGLVRGNGYDDENEWKGQGGVMLAPNAKKINSEDLMIVIGWKVPGWPDPKYPLSDSVGNAAVPRKRTKGSDSSSDDQSIINSKPARKAQKPGSKSKRGGVDTVANGEEAASSTSSGTSNDTSSDSLDVLQPYLDAWDLVQSNGTDIIWPFIVDMLQGTNSSLVYMAAWSIYSDLLSAPSSVTGTFFHGWTSMAWEEEQWANDSSISNDTLQEMYMVNDIILDLYSTAWAGGQAALNASGALDDLDFLGNAILALNNSLPATWTSVDETDIDPYIHYFTSYNSTVPDGEIVIPSTATGYAVISGTAMPLAGYPESWSSGAPYPNNSNLDSGTLAIPSGAVASGAFPSGDTPSQTYQSSGGQMGTTPTAVSSQEAR